DRKHGDEVRKFSRRVANGVNEEFGVAARRFARSGSERDEVGSNLDRTSAVEYDGFLQAATMKRRGVESADRFRDISHSAQDRTRRRFLRVRSSKRDSTREGSHVREKSAILRRGRNRTFLKP